MNDILLTKIGPLILSLIPLSLILINRISSIFSKHDPKLGDTTVICTNLTKTLTKDSLTVRTIFFDKYKTTIEDDSNFFKLEDTEEKDKYILVDRANLKKDEVLSLIAIATILCKYEKIKEIEETITAQFIKFGFGKEKTLSSYEIIDKVPFTSEKRFSTTIAVKKDTQEIFAFTKGNSYRILRKCTKTYIGGKKVELTSQLRRKIRNNIKRLNKNGQKAIGFAIKPLPKKRQKSYTEQFAEREMAFLGVVGITSPLNTEPTESIALAKQAGIKTYILTSEKEKKAAAIGKLLGLVNPHYFEAASGDYFRNLPDQKIEKMLANKEKDYVFAELTIEDKIKIMKILKNQGEIVAVVKPHKNGFQEVVESIKKGRIINKNQKKFANHAIACKIAEFILIASAILLKAPNPLSIFLILILDLFINMFLELALKSDSITEDVMSKNYFSEKMFSRKSLPGLLINGITMGIILSAVYIWALMRNGWTIGEKIRCSENMFISAATITFVLLTIMQIINAFNLKNPTKSLFRTNIFLPPYLLLTAVISILIIYILTNFTAFTNLLNLSAISSIEWQIILFSAVLLILIEELWKSLIKKT